MRPLILGILNVTPDSFSDGGQHDQVELALAHAERMLADGADLVDVGGESTRPGAAGVSVATELTRVLPVIESLAPRCAVSIDTRHPEVAREAVACGAKLINDVSASLAQVAADTGAGWIAVHMLGIPQTMQRTPIYPDVVGEVREFLVDKAQSAVAKGVGSVWIDPGFGFGKTLEHNLRLLAELDQLVATGFPVVVGTSRKSMLGQLLAASDGVESPVPAADRLVGSVATATLAMQAGAAMVRVHDVKATKQALTVVHGPLERDGHNDSSRTAASSNTRDFEQEPNRRQHVKGQA